MGCFIRINSQYKMENIMEVMTNILKLFGTNKNIIEKANKNMDKFKNNNCYWLELTNKFGEYSVTIYTRT